MVYTSALSTSKDTPLRVQVDSSSPWSDILLEELQASIRFSSPPISIKSFNYASRRTFRGRLRRYNKAIWLTIFLLLGCVWLTTREKSSIQAHKKSKKLSESPSLDGLQFIDANHPYLRFVGRWSSNADDTRKDGSFPGIYFDFAFNGSSTIFLSLHNADRSDQIVATEPTKAPTLAFLPSTNISNAEPISLLIRIDDDEYIVFHNATSTVAIRKGNLEPHSRHDIRVIAPMVTDRAVETLQVKGIYIDQGGRLLPFAFVETTASGNSPSGEDQTVEPTATISAPAKMLEIVTDMPGSVAGQETYKTVNPINSILSGVMGWEYLLGEMFGTDHVTIGMDGMCLIQECIGGTGNPAGLADVFFQRLESGPLGSEQYARPWLFQSYVPDVMVMNIGNSDWNSFQVNKEAYNKTYWELSGAFEDTYVSLIKAIRTLAYPKYSAIDFEAARYIWSPPSMAAGIPIFVMRPFRGQLEESTHAVVKRLRKEGDRSVFWLDTSGWLNTEVDFDGRADDQDFFIHDKGSSKEWRLTERGNQRVAILLHMHVCRYLAQDAPKCVFLPPEIYQGKALDPERMRLDEFRENERERKLKKLFWERGS